VNEAADASRHEAALLVPGRKIIYSEYDQYVTATAERLRKAGCREGDRIAISMPVGWPYAVLLFSILRIGAVACPLDDTLPPDRLDRYLDVLGCHLVIGEESQRGKNAGRRILSQESVVAFFGEGPGFEEPPSLVADRPAAIVFASREPGLERAVLHSFGNHYYSARGANHNIRCSSHCRWLLSTPLHDMTGLELLFQAAVSGAALVIPTPGEDIADSVESCGITHLSLTPDQLSSLASRDDATTKLKNVAAILVMTSREPAPALELARRKHLPVYPGYGLAEMAAQVATMRRDSPPAKRDTSGAVLKYREVRIANDGEILVRGPTLFMGYVERGEVSRSLDAEGWFATGDLGSLDADGYLTVRGRKPR